MNEKLEVTENEALRKTAVSGCALTQEQIEKYFDRCDFDDECDVCKKPEFGSYAVNLSMGECDYYICGKCAPQAIEKIEKQREEDEKHFQSLPQYDDDFEDDFEQCSSCDGHDACRDFGCAHKLGLGEMVQSNDL